MKQQNLHKVCITWAIHSLFTCYKKTLNLIIQLLHLITIKQSTFLCCQLPILVGGEKLLEACFFEILLVLDQLIASQIWYYHILQPSSFQGCLLWNSSYSTYNHKGAHNNLFPWVGHKFNQSFIYRLGESDYIYTIFVQHKDNIEIQYILPLYKRKQGLFSQGFLQTFFYHATLSSHDFK
jgi:hypothetical protein